MSPKDENRSEAVRAEKARLFLEQFIEIETEWISNWLSMENGEIFGADMALLTLEKYRWDDGYHFDTAGIETAITLFRDMLGGELAAGIVLASYVKNDRPIPEEFRAIHIGLLQPTLRATKSQPLRPKERRDYLMAWFVYLIHSQFGLPKTMRAGRKRTSEIPLLRLFKRHLSSILVTLVLRLFRPAHLVRQSAALLIDIRPSHMSDRATAVALRK